MMIRFFFLFLFFFHYINAAEVFFKKGITVPDDLKKRIIKYWQFRGDKLFEKTYSYELPYLQYLHSRLWYEKFFQNAPKFSKIEVKKIIKCDNKVCIIGLLLTQKYSPDNKIFIYDKWINLDKIWYHKYDDRPLPTF